MWKRFSFFTILKVKSTRVFSLVTSFSLSKTNILHKSKSFGRENIKIMTHHKSKWFDGRWTFDSFEIKIYLLLHVLAIHIIFPGLLRILYRYLQCHILTNGFKHKHLYDCGNFNFIFNIQSKVSMPWKYHNRICILIENHTCALCRKN